MHYGGDTAHEKKKKNVIWRGKRPYYAGPQYFFYPEVCSETRAVQTSWRKDMRRVAGAPYSYRGVEWFGDKGTEGGMKPQCKSAVMG